MKIKNLFCIVILLFVSGCATTYRANESFPIYFDKPKTVAVMPLDVKINQVTAGGVTELMDEWTDQAKKSITSALLDEFGVFNNVKLVFIDEKTLASDQKEFLRSQQGLYEAVAASILFHTYNPVYTFPHKIKNFDYTMGSDFSKISSVMSADAYLYCQGVNYIWTGGRVCLAVAAAFAGIEILPHSEWFAMTLIDGKNGDVVWFDFVGQQGDLREAALDRAIVKRLLNNFPRSTRRP